MKGIALLVTVSLALLASCTLVSSEDDGFAEGALLQTDVTEIKATVVKDFREKVVFDVPLTITNVTNERIALTRCKRPSAPVLQKLVDERWETAFAPIEQLCLSPPWFIEPGDTFVDTLRVRGFLPDQSAAPTFDTDLEGTYRLVHRLYRRPVGDQEQPSDLLPEPLRTSNTFTVIEQ